MRKLPLAALAAALVALVPAAAAGGAGLSFTPPLLLPHGDPKAHPYYAGGEPSIAFDPSGDGHVYVTAPQSIPTGAGYLLGIGDADQGVSVWSSADHGASFPLNVLTGAANGGGDSDVEVLADHRVLVADLEAAATDICTSTDFGRTFPDCDGGLATNQQGPENDREWLTRGTKPGEVYLTYHDFSGGFPIIERSTDDGQSFAPCGTIIDPGGPAAANYTPSGGTLVSKPVVAPDGTLYVEFATPDAAASPVGAALDHMYMAVAKGGCDGTTVFTDHLIYENPGASLANIFQATGMDAGGRLYVVLGGTLTSAEHDVTLYMFTSADGGTTWRHVQVNPPDTKANVLPAVAGGLGRGEAVVGWFGSTGTGDPNDTKAEWRYYAAATYDGGQTFNYATVTPDVIHHGDICTQGLFCGLVPGLPSNRNLADFSSAAVDPKTGCTALAIPGDPYNRPDLPNGDDNLNSSAYVARQAGARTCLTEANAGKAAGQVGTAGSSGTGAGCLDRVAPVSRISRRGRLLSRHGLRLQGSSSDRGCGRNGRGRVVRVGVAVGRAVGQRCRYVRSDGHFGPVVSCLRTSYLRARGTAHWRLTFRHALPPGKYVAWVRGVDSFGNVERKARRHNLLRFRIR